LGKERSPMTLNQSHFGGKPASLDTRLTQCEGGVLSHTNPLRHDSLELSGKVQEMVSSGDFPIQGQNLEEKGSQPNG
jgi:hypothetical protein